MPALTVLDWLKKKKKKNHNNDPPTPWYFQIVFSLIQLLVAMDNISVIHRETFNTWNL